MNRQVLLTAVMLLLGSMSLQAQPGFTEVMFQESISSTEIERIGRMSNDSGLVVFEQSLEGNGDFGLATNYITYSHSLQFIYPPLFSSADIRMLRLKLFLRNHHRDEIELDVDSLSLNEVRHVNFLTSPHQKGQLGMSVTALGDGILNVVLENPEEQFVLLRSVLKLHYRCDVTLDADDAPVSPPRGFAVRTNYPNPFNASTAIEFTLPKASRVRVDVFNSLGQLVTTLLNANRPAGEQRVDWDGTTRSGSIAPSGAYFYRITTDSFAETRKMILLK